VFVYFSPNRWAGRDVAVKVIEHNTDTTVPVEREVLLMLSFNHPHIVRAFHFVTRVHTSEVGVCCAWMLAREGGRLGVPEGSCFEKGIGCRASDNPVCVEARA
jgi:hypothetical protein